jgi:hypothetical protein
MALAQHVIQRLGDGRVLVRNTTQRRIYSDAVLRIGRDAGLFCFGLPDNHSHVGLEANRAKAGRFAQRLGVALRRRLDLEVSFAPVHVREIRDQAHLANAFTYMLAQATHHGIDADPWLEATAVPDLLGLRLNGAYLVPRVKALLPRLRRGDLLARFGLSELDVGTAIEDLADAAAATVAAPALVGNGPAVVAARRAAIAHALAQHIAVEEIAAALSLTARAVRKLAARPVDKWHVRAVGLQLGLRARLPRPTPSFDR